MCFFFGISTNKIQSNIKLKEQEFDFKIIVNSSNASLVKDGFTYSEAHIIKQVENEKPNLVEAHWEFIPSWVKDMKEVVEKRKKGFNFLNATAEKLLTSKSFSEAANKRRCLILATHFFEWKHIKINNSKKTTTQPYCIELTHQPYFFMAGIWQPWYNKETGVTIDTFAIVTTQANTMMQEIHNTKKRMPTILNQELAYSWVYEKLNEQDILDIASFKIDSNEMNAFTIAKDFKRKQILCNLFP